MIDGYTILIKIAENGMNKKNDKVVDYMKLFVSKYPNHDLTKPFTSLLNGDINPDNLVCLDGDETKNSMINLLINFQIFLNDKKLITNHDWDYEKIAKKFSEIQSNKK